MKDRALDDWTDLVKKLTDGKKEVVLKDILDSMLVPDTQGARNRLRNILRKDMWESASAMVKMPDGSWKFTSVYARWGEISAIARETHGYKGCLANRPRDYRSIRGENFVVDSRGFAEIGESEG